jgi:hypothetical protein
MAELDRLKEEVGHLKLWEGIGVCFQARKALHRKVSDWLSQAYYQ